ncbi:heme oxygenase-like protein [Zopfia rhizophila CBS 207.26]|uniref:Heme oxygenase-like protein n=1 Tax=Zopfia rhizophila CBS 207.26 TaxID=1314779 RepID=A0A6A6DTZ3_9PEZI|nr:heme oxygenase-like protein [Zopfia rhizophila CBS 207.26]
MSTAEKPWSLTSYLLTIDQDQFTRATQSPFLRLAAQGRLPKPVISNWLANDRLYMQGYIRLTGELLRTLPLPDHPTPSKSKDMIQVRLLDWLVDALVNIRREERFFIDVAERYGLDLNLAGKGETISEDKKIEGLRRFEKLFSSLTTGQKPPGFLPWLEGAVVFWATEKVYFEAWSWAKAQAASASGDVKDDPDGGAMRKEFIPNWTNDEFISFVKALEAIIDEGIYEAIGDQESEREEVCKRAEKKWKELLDAEEAFWPKI